MRGEFFGVTFFKQMNREDFNKEFGKYFLDISKLVFGGAVLSSIMQIEKINHGYVMAIGGFISLSLAIIGFGILRKK
jgi:hypothetical protein